VVDIGEWEKIFHGSSRNGPEYLGHRNYRQEDLDVPTVTRFPQKLNEEQNSFGGQSTGTGI
jgi:hypothetical protein